MIGKIETFLPPEVHGFTYVTNHHFVKLEDSAGNLTKLNAVGVLRGTCQICKAELLALENSGIMCCTHCKSVDVKWAWQRLQLAFVPEQESEFMGFAAAGKKP